MEDDTENVKEIQVPGIATGPSGMANDDIGIVPKKFPGRKNSVIGLVILIILVIMVVLFLVLSK